MISMDLLSIAQTQLQEARDALRDEMVEFLDQNSATTKDIGQKHPETREYVAKLPAFVPKQPYQWAKPDLWQQLRVNLQATQTKLITGKTQVDLDTQKQIKFENKILKTVELLRDKLDETRRGKAEVTRTRTVTTDPSERLITLAKQADDLGKFTDMWTVYHLAWGQQNPNKNIPPTTNQVIEIEAGNIIASGLYDLLQKQNLAFELDDPQSIIVVPFMSALYAGGFDIPTPYIVVPRWGRRQVWTWLGYVHEVGHHVYRNVKGLSDELKVNLALNLATVSKDYVIQRVWFNWLEEIFADLFGLLQIGPAFIQTQQRMLLYLPFKLVKKGHDVREELLQSADETHPAPHLRLYLTMRTLEKLLPEIPDAKLKLLVGKRLKQLKYRWNQFMDGIDTTKILVPARRLESDAPLKELKVLDFELIDEVSNIVLDTLLNTELYALAKHTNSSSSAESSPTPSPDGPPRTIKDVFAIFLRDTEYSQKLKAAYEAIIVDLDDTNQNVVISNLSNGVFKVIEQYNKAIEPKPFDIPHVLAAAQDKMEKLAVGAQSLAGLRFTVISTSTDQQLTQFQFETDIKDKGGQVEEKLSDKVDYWLMVGGDISSELQGVTVLMQEDFDTLVTEFGEKESQN